MLTPRCPDCKSLIDITDVPLIGEAILCPACKKEFTVTWLYPITLDNKNQNTLSHHSANIQLDIIENSSFTE
jgi:hypothetical protein